MSQNILFISVDLLKERSQIHGNIDEALLMADIKVAQDLYIHPLLGTALFKKIQTDIGNNALSGNYKTLVDSYIIDCLVWYTLAQSPETLSYQFTNKGIVRKQGDNTVLPDMSEIVSISQKYEKRAEAYATRCRMYLRQYAPTMYPEYLNPGSTIDTIRPQPIQYTSPVYIGPTYPHYRSAADKYQGDRPYCDDCY